MSAASLNDYEKAINQFLMNNGVTEHDELSRFLLKISTDYPDVARKSVNEMFRKINISLRDFSFEIRTVVIRNEDGTRTQFHSIANTEDDIVAREHGSNLDQHELKFFSNLAEALVEKKYLNSSEAAELKPPSANWRMSQTEEVILKFVKEGWLKRNDRNLLEIGTRTFFELSNHLQDIVKENAITNHVEFPQVIIY
jgi:hypothetical protein